MWPSPRTPLQKFLCRRTPCGSHDVAREARVDLRRHPRCVGATNHTASLRGSCRRRRQTRASKEAWKDEGGLPLDVEMPPPVVVVSSESKDPASRRLLRDLATPRTRLQCRLVQAGEARSPATSSHPSCPWPREANGRTIVVVALHLKRLWSRRVLEKDHLQ
jgi:hypothetical protein